MIYLDNAATTYPKPQSVLAAADYAAKKWGANPGRSGHAMSIGAAEEVYRARRAVAEFFHASGPECVVFTLNCTHAINLVIKGILNSGDHVVASCLEHNAVTRPLYALSEKGISFTEVQVSAGDHDATMDSFRSALRPNTRLLICTQASNVLGVRLPVERLAALAHQYGIPILVDCAQSAGVVPIDLADSGIDFLCLPGHKGLYGPMGVGVLVTCQGEQLSTVIEGGTGTSSISYEHPSEMPEHLESGTPNLSGIAGLRAGIGFVNAKGIERIFRHELLLVQTIYEHFSRDPRIQLYTERPNEKYFVPVLSFNIKGVNSEDIGQKLNTMGFAVRAGLHCAPAAHRFLGTLEQGTVRVCPSVFTRAEEINRFVMAVRKLVVFYEKRGKQLPNP